MRKIIHIDCDCFFAAVEMRDFPSLQGQPLAVGGSTRRRGVLSTCNYEARKFGLHSAMATSTALRLCPHLILKPHRFDEYRKASLLMHEIFRRYSDNIEPLSLDEAFIDVSNSRLFNGSASLIAQQIRHDIATEIGITASAGIATNKFLAKVASDWEKPNGQFVITPQTLDAFMHALPVGKIPGVGKKSMLKMNNLNIATCADLQKIDDSLLKKNFGVFATRLKELSFGRDDRPVCSERLRKSLSIETTFDNDIASLSESYEKLSDLYVNLDIRLQRFFSKVGDPKKQASIKSLHLKLKFFDFSNTTIACQGTLIDKVAFNQLLTLAWNRTGKPIRLIGIGVGFSYAVTEDDSHQIFSKQQQLSLFTS